MLRSNDLGFVIDSADLEKLKYFNSDASETQTVFVWVESREDKRFWRTVLLSNKRYRFEIKIPSQMPSSDGKSATGCKRLKAMHARGELVLGKFNILCIDGDDWFLPSLHTGVGQPRYIHNTRIYSIDNAFLDAGHVDQVLEGIAACEMDVIPFKPSELIRNFSEDSYEVVILLSYILMVDVAQGARYRASLRSSMQRLKLIEVDAPLMESKVYKEFKKELRQLADAIQNALIALGHQDDIIAYRETLRCNGVGPHNSFLFVRGHDIFDMVVVVMDRISKLLKHNEVCRVKSLESNADDEVRAIRNEWADVRSTLKQTFYHAGIKVEFLKDVADELAKQYS